jgi:hypothetical protein
MSHQLVSSSTIADYLTRDAAWALSHGAEGEYLMGLLYYALTYTLKARLAVCLGLGGGFVPRLMRQTQRDLGIAETSRTMLGDGNLPAAGYDYRNNPCGLASIHFGGLAAKPLDADVLALAPAILGRGLQAEEPRDGH